MQPSEMTLVQYVAHVFPAGSQRDVLIRMAEAIESLDREVGAIHCGPKTEAEVLADWNTTNARQALKKDVIVQADAPEEE